MGLAHNLYDVYDSTNYAYMELYALGIEKEVLSPKTFP